MNTSGAFRDPDRRAKLKGVTWADLGSNLVAKREEAGK